MVIPLGRSVVRLIRSVGRFGVFLGSVSRKGMGHPFYMKELIYGFWHIGLCAIPLVVLASFCTGVVLTLQTGDGFGRFGIGGDLALPEVVVLSMMRELGPVLVGLMMSGRWSATLTSELASMRLTSQIDALTTLSVDPMRYLLVPKILASIVAMPCLVLVAIVSGVLGGYVAAFYYFPAVSWSYINRVCDAFQTRDVAMGLGKGVIFGVLIGVVALYFGWTAQGGAQGIGRATTRSVVLSGFFVLILNFFVTSLGA